jgi:hypothetical protein
MTYFQLQNVCPVIGTTEIPEELCNGRPMASIGLTILDCDFLRPVLFDKIFRAPSTLELAADVLDYDGDATRPMRSELM